MIHAEQVHEGGVPIVDAHGVFYREVAQVVGTANGLASLNATAGHPSGEGILVMIAASLGAVGLQHGGATEFTSENYDGIFQ